MNINEIKEEVVKVVGLMKQNIKTMLEVITDVGLKNSLQAVYDKEVTDDNIDYIVQNIIKNHDENSNDYSEKEIKLMIIKFFEDQNL